MAAQRPHRRRAMQLPFPRHRSCDDQCAAPIPAACTLRPRSRRSGPTFSWAAVAPTCGDIRYEIQADDSCAPGALDACTFPSPELDAKGIADLTYAPATDLKVSTVPPVGAFYAWRVRACDASTLCGAWSEARYLHV